MYARARHPRRRLRWARALTMATLHPGSRLLASVCPAGHRIRQHQLSKCAHRMAHHKTGLAMCLIPPTAASPWETTQTSRRTRGLAMFLRLMNDSMAARTERTLLTTTWHMEHQVRTPRGICLTAPGICSNLRIQQSHRTRTASIDMLRRPNSLISMLQHPTRSRIRPSRRLRSSLSLTVRRHMISDSRCPGPTAADLQRMHGSSKLFLEAWTRARTAEARSPSRTVCP